MMAPVMQRGRSWKEYALLDGLMEAKDLADIAICLDADLQHDINAVNDFLRLYHEGYDLVYGVKRNRGKEPCYKKWASSVFYHLMSRLGSPVVKDHTDYSLMTRQVLMALSTPLFRGPGMATLLQLRGGGYCKAFAHPA